MSCTEVDKEVQPDGVALMSKKGVQPKRLHPLFAFIPPVIQPITYKFALSAHLPKTVCSNGHDNDYKARYHPETTMQQPEIIDHVEFCRRLRIGRTTFFSLRKEGKLVAGRHYFTIGKKVLFVWNEELFARFMEDCLLSETDTPDVTPSAENRVRKTPKEKRRSGRPAANVDY